MSQFPYSPYQPPATYSYGYPGSYGPDYYAPNKRAGLIMFINGGLMILCGIACGLSSLLPMDQVLAENAELQAQLASSGATTAILATVFVILGVIGFVLGAATIAMGFLTRGGSMTGAVMGIVLGGLVGLGLFLNILTSLVSGGGGQAILSALMLAIPLILCAVQVYLCIGAARNIPVVNAMQAQYQHQMYAYQQQYSQQQAAYYSQSAPPTGGYYGSQPGGAPPPPPPGNESGDDLKGRQ